MSQLIYTDSQQPPEGSVVAIGKQIWQRGEDDQYGPAWQRVNETMVFGWPDVIHALALKDEGEVLRHGW